MAKHPFFNRRRPKPPGIFRIGDRARPDVQAERTRLTLYITNGHLDLADELAREAGVPTIQRYCEQLLEEALEAEKARLKVDETEARQGPLQGLREIADDPEYLAEWNASVQAATSGESEDDADEIVVEVERRSALPLKFNEPSTPMHTAASSSILLHAGVQGRTDSAFIAYLRRGENPPAEVVADLVEALGTLDAELAQSSSIDRRLAYALHRLAFESQVLSTDAWPGAFDSETIHTLRALQEAVDRILSGEDIRYIDA